LTLVADDQDHPVATSFYSLRFGFGVGNRLNGVAMDLHDAAGGYLIPPVYA
jgi:hypothetical protein